MTFYHLEFAKTGSGMSGGETWMVSVIKELSRLGHKNVLLTTSNGMETYKSIGLIPSKNIEYRVLNTSATENKIKLLFSYFSRSVRAIRLMRNLNFEKNSYLICHSDFLPNTLPFWYMTRRRNNLQLNPISIFHMLAPKLLRGYEGHYLKKFKFPSMKLLYYKMNQYLYLKIINSSRSMVITNNKSYIDTISAKAPKSAPFALKHFASADHDKTESTDIKSKKRTYDIVWMGRFHPQKGIKDLPKILETVKKQVPKMNVLVIGDGDDNIKEGILHELDDAELSSNVTFAGYVTGSEKYELLKKSKVFIMTSYYESYGIVILESLHSGTPVVAYDLPVYDSFRDAIDIVQLGNPDSMSEQLVKLLENSELLDAKKAKCLKHSAKFSWEKTTLEFLNCVSSHGLKVTK